MFDNRNKGGKRKTIHTNLSILNQDPKFLFEEIGDFLIILIFF